MRVERDVLQKALQALKDEGYLVVESLPRAGLTLLLSQIGSHMFEEMSCVVHYINCAMPGGSLASLLLEHFPVALDSPYSSLRSHLRQAGPTLLLLDGLDKLCTSEQKEFFAFIDLLRSERLFDSALATTFVVVGVCGSSAKSKVKLGFFSKHEVATLLRRTAGDHVVLAVHAWSGGSPEVTQELAQDLILREANVHDVYQAVHRNVEKGRLGALVKRRATPQELWQEGLVRSSKGKLVPIPALALAKKLCRRGESGLTIDKSRREVRYDGSLIPCFPREYLILCLLASNPGNVLTPGQIYSQISGEPVYLGEGAVKAQLSRLRSKLPREEQWIVTKRGFGYFFNPAVSVTFV